MWIGSSVSAVWYRVGLLLLGGMGEARTGRMRARGTEDQACATGGLWRGGMAVRWSTMNGELVKNGFPRRMASLSNRKAGRFGHFRRCAEEF